MRNGANEIIGIRLRNTQGEKWAVTGSHNGLFLPQSEPDRTCYVCEGPTDTAAALTIGLYAIGRPSCRGQEGMVIAWLRRIQAKRVVIVADNDPHNAGVDGADKLQAMLPMPSCVLITPSKDLRAMVKAGYDSTVVGALVDGLIWTKGKR